MAQRFPFLHPSRVKDAAGRRPGDVGYDARTVSVPPSWFRDNKVTEAQQQWWGFKAANWDSVLLFKMGKFYEVRFPVLVFWCSADVIFLRALVGARGTHPPKI